MPDCGHTAPCPHSLPFPRYHGNSIKREVEFHSFWLCIFVYYLARSRGNSKNPRVLLNNATLPLDLDNDKSHPKKVGYTANGWQWALALTSSGTRGSIMGASSSLGDRTGDVDNLFSHSVRAEVSAPVSKNVRFNSLILVWCCISSSGVFVS